VSVEILPIATYQCRNYLVKLCAPQAVTYTIKVVVSNKWRELLHTTNRKYHIAYLFVPFPMTLEGHSPNAPLIKCNSTNTVLTDTARRAVLRR